MTGTVLSGSVAVRDVSVCVYCVCVYVCVCVCIVCVCVCVRACVHMCAYTYVICCHAAQTIEIPALKITKEVKTMQMFKQPVERAAQVYLSVCLSICMYVQVKMLPMWLLCSKFFLHIKHT